MQLYRFKKRICRGGKPLAFLYKPGIFLFVDRLFLVASNGELRRNRHDIYAQTINEKYTKL
jgi:hypothetical protein